MVLVADVDFELVLETLVAEVVEVAEVVVEEEDVLVDVDVGVVLVWVGGEEEGGGLESIALSNPPFSCVDGRKTHITGVAFHISSIISILAP